MARISRKKTKLQRDVLPIVVIVPEENAEDECPLRTKEIQNLVAEIIILGRKKGHSSRRPEELKNVA